MSENDVESLNSDFSRLNVSDSAECLLLGEMREMLTQEWISYLSDNKRGKSLSRIRAGAPAAGELSRVVRDMQQKMSGEKYLKMQTFIREFRDLPGVTAMEDTLLKLSVHLETAPPETGNCLGRDYRGKLKKIEFWLRLQGVGKPMSRPYGDGGVYFPAWAKTAFHVRQKKKVLSNCMCKELFTLCFDVWSDYLLAPLLYNSQLLNPGLT